MKKINVAPSLICLDLCNLEKEVQDVERLGADMLHVDLLDGYFSPSMPIGLDVIRQVRQITDLPFDVHLMVVKNDFFLEELYNIGVQRISIHAEGTRHLDKTLAEIKMHGIEAGIALCPATPLHVLEFAKARCDFILHMMINPGMLLVITSPWHPMQWPS